MLLRTTTAAAAALTTRDKTQLPVLGGAASGVAEAGEAGMDGEEVMEGIIVTISSSRVHSFRVGSDIVTRHRLMCIVDRLAFRVSSTGSSKTNRILETSKTSRVAVSWVGKPTRRRIL